MGKKLSKKEYEEKYGKDGPWWLMYLFFVPLFLIAVVPEGFFTWQVILIFAVIMSIPFVVMWLLYRNKPNQPFSNMDSYIQSLKRDNEIREQLIKENEELKNSSKEG